MSLTYRFTALPHYLKVSKKIAENIKPNTKYRIAIYKGADKLAYMKKAVKGELVDGDKVYLMSTPQLQFQVPIYFTYNLKNKDPFEVRLYEYKPNELKKTQIATYIINIKQLIDKFDNKEDQSSIKLADRIQLEIQIFLDICVGKSKELVNQKVDKILFSRNKLFKKHPQCTRSQRDLSRNLGGMCDTYVTSEEKSLKKKNYSCQGLSTTKKIQSWTKYPSEIMKSTELKDDPKNPQINESEQIQELKDDKKSLQINESQQIQKKNKQIKQLENIIEMLKSIHKKQNEQSRKRQNTIYSDYKAIQYQLKQARKQNKEAQACKHKKCQQQIKKLQNKLIDSENQIQKIKNQNKKNIENQKIRCQNVVNMNKQKYLSQIKISNSVNQKLKQQLQSTKQSIRLQKLFEPLSTECTQTNQQQLSFSKSSVQ